MHNKNQVGIAKQNPPGQYGTTSPQPQNLKLLSDTVTETNRTGYDYIVTRLRTLCQGEFSPGSFTDLEEICEQHEMADIEGTILRMYTDSDITNMLEFFATSVRYVESLPVKPVQVMLTLAVVHGNTLFTKIPEIMRRSVLSDQLGL